MPLSTFIATTGSSVVRATQTGQKWIAETVLEGIQVQCLAQDKSTIYAGTPNGVYRSDDEGKTWHQTGLPDTNIKSIATTRASPGTVFAGTRPPMIYVSHDRGQKWEELPAFRKRRQWWWFTPAEPPFWEPYVLGLTVSPTDPNLIIAGVEYGALLRSTDGGKTWSKHLHNTDRDCHSVSFNALDGQWVYEGGGGSAVFSSNGGSTWKRFMSKNYLTYLMQSLGKTTLHHGIDRHYGWAAVGDPHRPHIWYFTASISPMKAHAESGDAQAHIFRTMDGVSFQKLTGGLPDPLPYMPYSLVTDVEHTGHLYAGMSNGDIWHTTDYGDSWEKLDVNLGGIHRQMIGF